MQSGDRRQPPVLYLRRHPPEVFLDKVSHWPGTRRKAGLAGQHTPGMGSPPPSHTSMSRHTCYFSCCSYLHFLMMLSRDGTQASCPQGQHFTDLAVSPAPLLPPKHKYFLSLHFKVLSFLDTKFQTPQESTCSTIRKSVSVAWLIPTPKARGCLQGTLWRMSYVSRVPAAIFCVPCCMWW